MRKHLRFLFAIHFLSEYKASTLFWSASDNLNILLHLPVAAGAELSTEHRMCLPISYLDFLVIDTFVSFFP